MNNPQYLVEVGEGKRASAKLQVLAETPKGIPVNIKLVRYDGTRVTECASFLLPLLHQHC